MNSQRLIALMFAVTLLLPLAACEVRQTQEGEMPEVEVTAGELPEYDVDAADVEIGWEEREIEVPTGIDVETEKRDINVPDIEVTPPDEDVDDDEPDTNEY